MFELALVAQVLVWLVVVGLFLASGQASLFHPATVYLVFHVLVFVIRPLLVYYLGFDSVWTYIGFRPSEADMIQALAVSSVALIVFMGTNLIFGRACIAYPAERAKTFSPIEGMALILTACLLAPLIAYSIFTAASGGTGGERAANGVFIMTNSTGYVNDAQFMIAPLLCAWLLLARFHWLNSFPIALFVAYRAWCGWSRFTIITFFLAIVMAYCWHQKKKWLPLSAILLGIPVLILFNTLGHNRDYLQNYLKGRGTAALEIENSMSKLDQFRARADTQDFANFDYLVFLLSVVPEKTQTYTYGSQYLQLFTEPIPRILWKGKPAGAPVRTFDIGAYGNFVGLTFSLPGDGWCSGGWLGLIITMAIVGGLLGLFHQWFWRHVNHPMVAIFYISAMATIIQWYRDGGISISKFIMWNWLPLLIWLGLSWLLGLRLRPGHTIILRSGKHVRLVQSQ